MALLVHRNTQTSTAQRWIAVSTCWHLDTWFFIVQEQPWLVARTADGMGKLIGLTAWELRCNAFALWERGASMALEPDALATLGDGVLITSPQARAVFGGPVQADAAFKCTAQPLGALWPRGTYPRRSIRHHMVAPVYAFDPAQGFRNMYAETGRAERDIAFAR